MELRELFKHIPQTGRRFRPHGAVQFEPYAVLFVSTSTSPLLNATYMQLHFRLAPDRHAMLGSDEAGNEIRIALPELAGGNNTGLRAMQLMIMSLGGCAAVDVLNILRKQRQYVLDLQIDIEAERFQQPLPAPWEKAHLVFTVFGKVDSAKAEFAVTRSLEKYCSASETLRLAGATITWETRVVEA